MFCGSQLPDVNFAAFGNVRFQRYNLHCKRLALLTSVARQGILQASPWSEAMAMITVRIIKDEDSYVSQCLDYDIASQGRTRTEAIENIREAVSLFLEVASPDEIQSRLESCGQIEQLSVGSA